MERNFGDGILTKSKFLTHHIQQININFFAVQQSIDHMQMSIRWSPNQCVPSTLHFVLSSSQFLIKTHIRKSSLEREFWRCGCWLNQHLPLTLFCKLISISSQSNSRLTTLKCPLLEAKLSAVSRYYIFSSSPKF